MKPGGPQMPFPFTEQDIQMNVLIWNVFGNVFPGQKAITAKGRLGPAEKLINQQTDSNFPVDKGACLPCVVFPNMSLDDTGLPRLFGPRIV